MSLSENFKNSKIMVPLSLRWGIPIICLEKELLLDSLLPNRRKGQFQELEWLFLVGLKKRLPKGLFWRVLRLDCKGYRGGFLPYWYKNLSIEFADVLQKEMPIIAFGPKDPPLQYLYNLKDIVADESIKNVNKVLDFWCYRSALESNTTCIWYWSSRYSCGCLW